MPRKSNLLASTGAAGALTLALAACGPGLPASVVKGSTIRVGWSHDLTSLNTATRDGATTGNLDVAAMTRGRFATLVDGDVQPDKDFGRVTVREQDPFTVRYDLTEHSWSDGIPVDAADLMLAWAAGSNSLTKDAFESVPSDLAQSDAVPGLDEFERRIDVTFTHPVVGWQTALDVAVPAHVVGMHALGVEDPMEAKQAVIDAIREKDAPALRKIAKSWNDDFDLDPEGGKAAPEALLSNGPYRVQRIERGEGGTELVRLVPNNEYGGPVTPTFEHVELVRSPDAGQLADLGERLDVAQVAPTPEAHRAIRELERRDYEVATSSDGRMWVLVLRADRGVLRRPAARRAFLHAVPRPDVTSAGAGLWSDEYEGSDAVLFNPRAKAYQFAVEDSGFRALFARQVGEAKAERSLAGVPAGTALCVLYDRDEAFAVGAVRGLRAGVAEAGWGIRDCGAKDAGTAASRLRSWDAALVALPVPETPADIAAVWGSGKLSGAVNRKRDALIAALRQAADPYAAQHLRVQIEASIVGDAVALPLTMQPLITVTDPDVEGVVPRGLVGGSLTALATKWSPADD